MRAPEKLTKASRTWVRIGRGAKRYLKRTMSRWRRRTWRRLGEDAPRQDRNHGWYD